tara:strand:- start:591 stop:1055 length:465 start_codon:yes stop_codon:yes gene_type:complete
MQLKANFRLSVVVDISIVAKRSGVPASTLRYYEEKGLIRSVGRKGLRRLFAADILERLALIALGRVAGFSLDEISSILGGGDNPNIDREMLITKATELDRTIQKLTDMRDGLQHAAACTAPSHLECPRFRRLMGLAASGDIKGQPSNKRVKQSL